MKTFSERDRKDIVELIGLREPLSLYAMDWHPSLAVSYLATMGESKLTAIMWRYCAVYIVVSGHHERHNPSFGIDHMRLAVTSLSTIVALFYIYLIFWYTNWVTVRMSHIHSGPTVFILSFQLLIVYKLSAWLKCLQ